MKIENVWTKFALDNCQIIQNIHFSAQFGIKIEKMLTDFVVDSYQIIKKNIFCRICCKIMKVKNILTNFAVKLFKNQIILINLLLNYENRKYFEEICCS